MRWLQVEATGRESVLLLPITSMVMATAVRERVGGRGGGGGKR